MKKIFLIYSLVIVGFVVFLYGCSEVKNDLTVATVPGIHATGWVDPSSANFHGKSLETTNYDLNACKSCHGGDFSGGTSGVSCSNCHASPQSCNLCHGNNEHINPPKSLNGGQLNTDRGVGAHVQHLTSDTTQRHSAIVECNECHLPVNSFADSNHISKDGQKFAKVIFGTLSRTVTEGVTPNPTWNKEAQTCTNTYCHGTFKNGNQSAAPVFNDPGSVVCGSCHGNPTTGSPLPGGSHTQIYPNRTQCYLCHFGVMKPDGSFRDQSRHINGVVDIGNK